MRVNKRGREEWTKTCVVRKEVSLGGEELRMTRGEKGRQGSENSEE